MIFQATVFGTLAAVAREHETKSVYFKQRDRGQAGSPPSIACEPLSFTGTLPLDNQFIAAPGGETAPEGPERSTH